MIASKMTRNLTDLRHNNILASKLSIRVRVIEIHGKDGDRGACADLFHRRHFRFGFARRHEPVRNTRDDDTTVADVAA